MKILVSDMPKEAKECYYSVFVNGQHRCSAKQLPYCNLKSNATKCHLLKLFEQVKDDCK